VSDSILGRYRVLESLGAGGMGDVFLAQREGSPELCVLKRLREELIGHGTARPRFAREAQIATLLDHPGIARTIDAGFENGAFYIAMEFIAGVDLFAIWSLAFRRQTPLPIDFSVTVVMRALEALTYAHGARDAEGKALEIVHRDLAPKNVMLTFDGRVKVIDFGVARANVGDFKTSTGTMIGTMRYFSPEQARAIAIDGRSDLYTLSVVLHEMLSGRALVEPGEIYEMIRAVLVPQAPPIRSLRPEVSEKLEKVLARGLAKDANARWPDAAAYLDALEKAADGLPESAMAKYVCEWFPAEEEVARQRIERARRWFDSSGEQEPALFTITRAEEPSRPLPRPKKRDLRALIPVSIALAAAGTIALVQRAKEPKAPPPPPRPPVVIEQHPQVVQRQSREPLPVAVPEPPPPATERKKATKKEQPLVRVEPEHRHDLDPEKLAARLRGVQARLQNLEDDRSFRGFERRFLDVQQMMIGSEMDAARCREVCALLDALERDLR
jgi:eukaryotic-like serine/threonine-protein kinase